MSDDRCPCGEDTPEGCAKRPAKHCGRFAHIRAQLDEAVAMENAVRSDGPKQDPYPKRECLTDPRDEEIEHLRQWNAALRTSMSGHVREMDRLAGRHHDALVARDHYKRLCAAAGEFLRSPALHTLRVGERRFSREELIDYLADMDGGPT